MVRYTVKLYPEAFRNIDDIYIYLALEKQAPNEARGQTDRIWAALESLEYNPESHQYRLVGRYAGNRYRQILIDNYVAIYKIDALQRVVYVVTVQYQGRDM